MTLQQPISETQKQYQAIMLRIRNRYEIIQAMRVTTSSEHAHLETTAFHLRKVIEGIAFGCLVALRNGLQEVPRDAVGQWNADTIFARLKKRDKLVFPLAIQREDPAPGFEAHIKHHLVEDKSRAITSEELREIYRRTHIWLHEWNPYVASHGTKFEERCQLLIDDAQRVWDFIGHHLIHIAGKVFIGVLKSPEDDGVHVYAAEALD